MDSFKSGDMFVNLQIRPPFTSLLEKVTSNNVFVISSAKGVSYLHPFITRGKNVSVRGGLSVHKTVPELHSQQRRRILRNNSKGRRVDTQRSHSTAMANAKTCIHYDNYDMIICSSAAANTDFILMHIFQVIQNMLSKEFCSDRTRTAKWYWDITGTLLPYHASWYREFFICQCGCLFVLHLLTGIVAYWHEQKY